MTTKDTSALLDQGAKLLAQGNADQAIKIFLKSIKQAKHLPEAYFNLALSYMQKNQTVKAIQALEQVIELKPSDYEAYNLLGHLFMTQGDITNATACFQQAIKINPMLVEGLYNLGVAYMNSRDYHQAAHAYKQSLKLFPGNSIVLNNLGVTYQKLGLTKEAIKVLNRAIKLSPTNAHAYINLGTCYIATQPFKAAKLFARAINIDPQIETAHYNLAVCMRMLSDVDTSITHFQKAIELKPDYLPSYGQLYHQLKEACSWSQATTLSKTMAKKSTQSSVERLSPHTPFTSAVYQPSGQDNLAVAQLWSQAAEATVAPYEVKFDKYQTSKGPIKIGYLSNDFRDHATTHLLAGLIREHDRSKFEIHLFSWGKRDKSDYFKRITHNVTYHDITSHSDTQAARLIHELGINILIDLKGHTSGSRLEILAMRPAPVQIHFLGFPGSTGASFIDYIVTDSYLTPPKLKADFSEKLIYLPHTYQPTDNLQPIVKHRISLDKMLVEKQGPVFCCFNHPYKITPEMFEMWLRCLKAVPELSLCLLATNNSQIDNLLALAIKRKLYKHQLIFLPKMKKSYHLARLRLFDLALDTSPCNGMTTTTDSLWAGTPVLTVEGRHFASRVSGSLLSAVGLPELITPNHDAYLQKMYTLATNPDQLQALKLKLATNLTTTPLFDTKAYTQAFESALATAWSNYRLKKPPTEIKIKDTRS